jgi:hypothetical protein
MVTRPRAGVSNGAGFSRRFLLPCRRDGLCLWLAIKLIWFPVAEAGQYPAGLCLAFDDEQIRVL